MSRAFLCIQLFYVSRNKNIDKKKKKTLLFHFLSTQLMCPQCCHIYLNSKNLQFHLRGVHKIGPPLICKFCGIEGDYQSLSGYYNHTKQCKKNRQGRNVKWEIQIDKRTDDLTTVYVVLKVSFNPFVYAYWVVWLYRDVIALENILSYIHYLV